MSEEIRQNTKAELDVEEVAEAILDAQELLEGKGTYIHLLQSDRRLIANVICARFRPANAEKLVEALEDIAKAWMRGPDGWQAKLAKEALAEYEKGQVKA